MHIVPNILLEIPAPPEALFIKGSPLDDDFEGVAIVGTRKATPEGLTLAEKTAHELALAGIPVISGLAFGIDSAAHRGCLKAKGTTVAVLAGGIKKIYPASNEFLADEIVSSGGSIISEYEDTTSYPDMFLKRNRIVSGLSKAVIVIEAPFRSGAVSTANWAAEQGREVLVFPGPHNHPNYGGSHKLIRDGARLVSSINDIFSDLGIEKNENKATHLSPTLSKNAALVLKTISGSTASLSIDKLISETKLEPQKVLSSLSELCMAGNITETVSGYALNVN